MKTNSTRRSREEILDLFRACQAKIGKTPGKDTFFKTTGVKLSEINYYWPNPNALAEEAGALPNELQARLPDEDVFCDYAKVCLSLGKVPTNNELRIAQRELKTRTHTVYKRHGSIQIFQKNFRAWLATAADDLKPILEFTGWSSDKDEIHNDNANAIKPTPQVHPFLPACIQYLDVLARGETPPFETLNIAVSTIFERRTADAFRCLGFEMQQFGQGTGRNADALACAPRERVALIIDAKVRVNGYSLGTEDRKFLDYATKHGKELQRQGFEHLYLVVVAPSFRESDLKKLAEFLSESPIRSVAMITAKALMRMVEESIRNRSQFSLGDFTKQIFGNKIVSD